MKFAKIMRTSCLFLPFAFFLSFTFWHQKLNGQQDYELWPLQTNRVNFNLKMKIDRSSRYHFKILDFGRINSLWIILSYIHYYLWWPVLTIILSTNWPLAKISQPHKHPGKHPHKHPHKHHTTSHVTHAHATHTHIIIHVNTFCWSWCCDDDDSDVFDD
jgi:hypothetical protein